MRIKTEERKEKEKKIKTILKETGKNEKENRKTTVCKRKMDCHVGYKKASDRDRTTKQN